jgi:RNA 2',3'-cyclic 3'-phosphodiesterase
MRLFVAIELSGPARDTVLDARAKLVEFATRQGVRFVKPEKLHLTLTFLGQVAEDRVENLKTALNGLSDSQGFTLISSELGGFPDLRRPKVIWLGMEGEIGKISELANRVQEITKPFAPEQDDKQFSPHITLARISPGSKDVGRIVQHLAIEVGAEMPVTEIALFHSKSDGSYEKLHSVKLT